MIKNLWTHNKEFWKQHLTQINCKSWSVQNINFANKCIFAIVDFNHFPKILEKSSAETFLIFASLQKKANIRSEVGR
jgi:hypothetical protein